MTNYLITGGCGFIGSSLINELKKNKKNRIRIVDNLSVGSKNDLYKIIDFEVVTKDKLNFKSKKHQLIIGDITNTLLCKFITKNVDNVIHLAANTAITKSLIDPLHDCKVNIIGTLNILEGCRNNNVKKLIFSSSAAVGGELRPPISEKIIPKPISPYGASKLAGEGYCSTYYKTFGIETVVLRFGNVYGPGSKNKTSVVAKFINNALSNKPIEIYGSGKQTRDYVFIDDLIKAITQSIKIKNIGGEVFQIATSKETSILQLIKELKINFKNQFLNEIDVIRTDKIKGEMMRNFSNTNKAKKILKWNASIKLNEGLKKTIKYFIEDKKN